MANTHTSNNYGYSGFRKKFYYFFWWMSGAKIEYLLRFETEHEKYLSIGFTVFITGVLAFLSGTGAFYLLFGSLPLAIFMGIIWGIVIMNLDRYITITMKKKGNSLDNPDFIARMGLFFQELIPAVPRIIIAIILGTVISIPLEVYLFKDHIDEHKRIDELKQKELYQDELRESEEKEKNRLREKIIEIEETLDEESRKRREEVKYIQDEIENINKKITSVKDGLKKMRENHLKEWRGDSSASGVPGNGPRAKILEGDYNEEKIKADQEIEKYRQQISNRNVELEEVMKKPEYIKKLEKNKVDLQNRLYTLENKKDSIEETVNTESENTLIKRIKILLYLIEEDNDLFKIHFIIISLIIIIELSPIIVKLLSRREGYEAYIDMLTHQHLSEFDKVIKDIRAKNEGMF